ncbi:hypothetical protein HJC23_005206 [Cyclotella cryptica]|uniref:SKI-interacting protein SKIP SNW domain-containing protein n=1 Tax=Cyclotella cryptica TaxID=29204 RepID=A0ABD3P397_9STRA|eukprot:CCRYP_017796-RA/>CCRYP_017796-RA protein AED:0.00 eAED:0.00 QI:244/-1/1/1/-1/1/1/822/605
MASLYLPAPTRSGSKVASISHDTAISSTTSSAPSKKETTVATATAKRVPSYASRCDAALRFSQLSPEERRQPSSKAKLFVPRSTADFDDGGSFPEIHVAQYPRHMGNPHLPRGGAVSGDGNAAPTSRAIITRDVLSATVDSSGKVSYDAIVTGGTNADKKVYTKHSDLRGCAPNESDLALPTEEETLSTAERTQRALNSLISTKVSSDKPTGDAISAAIDSATAHSRTQFIKYTPHESAPGYNPLASQRMIRMVPAQIDPMMPPKHKHRKAPRGPAEDPVPVLHAPPEKLSKEERAAWNIPACISNWKNARGYTIPLDKRLAADGRGLRDDTTINSNFAVLSESLYVAERQAREEVRTRATVQKRLVLEERGRREEELRELANKARLERGGVNVVVAASGAGNDAGRAEEGAVRQEEDEDSVESVTQQQQQQEADSAQGEERIQRDRLRAERRREREKEYRLERAGKAAEFDATEEELAKKKRRLENDRDISEKIALGTHVGNSGAEGVDSRLYSQNAGLDSGFGADDEYNAFSRPMFDREGVTSSSIYRPTRGEAALDADEQYDQLKRGATSKFAPDKGFGGADGGAVQGGANRNAPVQFEKAK